MNVKAYVLRIATTVSVLCAWAALPAVAEDAAAEAAAKITYDDHVRPIFREHCFTCHRQDNAKSDLALDSYAAVMRGGASGEVIFAGDLESSRLWMLVSHEEEPKMPPMQDKLADAKLETIKGWILGGSLENAGSKAKVSNKPSLKMATTSGSARPEGPPPMPEGLSRQPIVYTPKTRAITALAASPWAPLVAVAGHQQISLYHTDTGELLGILPFPEGVPHVLRFSRNGSLLLAGGGRGGQSGRVVVFDVKTGQRAIEVGEEVDVVLAADINEDHTRIALGGPGRVVRVFDTADGKLLHEIRKHNDWIYAVEFSPDGVLLATADRGGDLFVWEAETAREYQNLKAHAGPIKDVSWRLDSNVLASCGEDGTIRLWEMEAGQQVKNWGAHGGGCASVKFTHDGRLVSAGRDRQVKTWDAAGAQQHAFEAFPDVALRAVFTHDGGRVIGGDWTGQVRMWNGADGQQVALLAMNPPTLEIAAANAATAAAEAQSAAAAATAAVEAAKQTLEQKLAATKAAADQLAAAQAAVAAAEAAVKAAEAEKVAAEQQTA
ncbi:MAG: c-type cytochrome domain-containing protein, partial [Pirellulales bacterium]